VKLEISNNLSLPIETATQTTLIVGKRGSGKTNSCVVLAEELYRAKAPFVAIDPADVWWGLKASRDGKGPGLGVYVFGGRHADLPLEPTAGALMADVLVDDRISAVLSVKHFTVGQRSRFVTDFAKRLLARNTDPVHVFLEEAHEVAPQVPAKREKGDEGDEAQMAGAVNRLWKLGRSSGIGGSAITQRPASLSKNVTTQAEILIVHRTIGPQDVAAVREWIKYHGDSEAILGELATLKTGECFLWAPDFPESKPIGLVRVRIRERVTFDSSATPKAGEQRREPKELAVVDLAALNERMKATIERARAEDPRELHARIRELEREARLPRYVEMEVDASALNRAREEARAEVAAGVAKEAQQLVARVVASANAGRERAARTIDQALGQMKLAADALRETIDVPEMQVPAVARQTAAYKISAPENAARRVPVTPPQMRSENRKTVPSEGLTGPEQRILDAIAWLESIGNETPEQPAVAFLAGYTFGGGAFNNPRGALNTKGLVEYVGKGIRLTDAGRALARVPDAPLSTEELHRRVLERLPGPEQRLLRPCLDAYPESLSNEELAAAAGYTAGAGAFNNPRGRLRSLGLVDYPQPGRVVARDVLFLRA
jgi:hypothetical protein